MIKKIYLAPMSHCDPGYTNLTAAVLQAHIGHLRHVLALCRGDEKYKWTCEEAWTVKVFLADAAPEEKDDFFHFVHTGQIEIGAFWGTLQFELPDEEELIRSCRYSTTLAGLLERMEHDRYPYDSILLQCAADNRGPDRDILTTIDALNRDYSDLTFILATPSEYFSYMENKYQTQIPTYCGDFIDSWSDGAGAMAEATAEYRECRRKVFKLEYTLARAGRWSGVKRADLVDLKNQNPQPLPVTENEKISFPFSPQQFFNIRLQP